MTTTTIECKNRDMLDTFLFGLRFAKSQFNLEASSLKEPSPVKILRGSNETGTLHWLTIEDGSNAPDSTYRLTKKGLRLYTQGKLI